jgi:hypothetical protein
MTARLYIIRGIYILFWFFYESVASYLVDSRTGIKIDFLVGFGVLSLIIGIILAINESKLSLLVLSLVMSIVGLIIGFSGFYVSYASYSNFIRGGVAYGYKSISSLAFGIIVSFLYIKSIKETLIKLLSFKN